MVSTLQRWILPIRFGPVLRERPGPAAVFHAMAGEEAPDEAGPEGFHHVPVMVSEVVAALEPAPGRIIFDGTLGGGGHSEALLEAGATVIACDRDPEAVAHAGDRLARFGDRFRAVQGNFEEMDRILGEARVGKVDGILLDLGVSSHQLDREERGFSFSRPGPLDMRMNPGEGSSAADLVNGADAGELTRIFFEFGEEPLARRVARALVAARETAPIETTSRLAEIVESVVPRRSGKHPATRVFQALRMAVNDELGAVEIALGKVPGLLVPGGVLAVITFHSLEDRLVKRFLRDHSAPTLDRPEWPEPRPNPDWHFELPSRKPIQPGPGEIERNRRARSAKLRVAIRIADPGPPAP